MFLTGFFASSQEPHQNQGGHIGAEYSLIGILFFFVFVVVLLLATQYDNHVQENITLCWVKSSGSTNFENNILNYCH